jgi:hypothetical protein
MANTGGRRDDWRTTATDRTGKGGGKGGRRWAAAALVVALLGGLLASWPLFLNKTPDPLCFAVPIGEYHKASDSVWPPNPWAENDARGLRQPFEGESAQAFQHQEKGTFTRELGLIVQRANDTRRPLVVYVSALGTVANDTPYLLPADARPNDPTSWLTLDEVLTPVRTGGRERLLILDVRPVRSPRADLPTGDVNELIDARLAKLHADHDLPVLVFTANTPPAGPLALPTARHTAFGLALERGIQGAADGWLPNTSKNLAVSARELAAYVSECTFAATGGGQLPQLYGHQDDFKLVNVSPTPPDPPAAERLPYPDFLAAAWAEADKARASGLPARAPRAVRQFTDAAADAERWWLAGANVQVVKDRYAGTLATFQAELPALAPSPAKVVSVARSRQADRTAFDAHVRVAAAALLPVVTRLKSPAHADKRKANPAEALTQLDADLANVKLPPEVPFAAVAAVLWAAAVDAPLPAVAADLLYVADKVAVKDKPPLAELAALQVAALVPDSRDGAWVAAVLPVWYETTAVGEEAVLFDPRGLPAVADQLKAADDAYRAEAVAMVGPKTPSARLKLVVTNLQEVRDRYARVRTAGEGVTAAWRQVEGARAALADLADRFPHEFHRRARDKECSLVGLTDEFTDVVGLLRSPTPPDGTRLKKATEGLETQLMAVLPPPPPAGQDPRLLESAMEWPQWAWKDRKEMVERVQAASDQTLSRWPNGPSGRPLTPPTRRGAEVFQESVTILRNQTALVRTWDEKFAKEVQAELAPKTVTPERFTRAAERVAGERRAGAKRAFQGTALDRGFFGWAVSPRDVPGVPTSPLATTNPEVVARREADAAYARRVADSRYRGLSNDLKDLDESTQSGGPRGTRFAPAVRRYGDVADSLVNHH